MVKKKMKKAVKKKATKKKATKKKTTKKKTTRTTNPALHRHIRRVLKNTAKSSKKHPYLTAYQILELLPTNVRNNLIVKYGLGGKGGETVSNNSATKQVAIAARAVTKDVLYMKTSGISYEVKDADIQPSGKTCGLFRLIPNTRR